MTGKELILVLGGATVMAGAGGVGVSLAMQDDAGPNAPDERVLAQLEKLDRSLQDTREAVEDGRSEVRALAERVSRVENGVANGHWSRDTEADGDLPENGRRRIASSSASETAPADFTSGMKMPKFEMDSDQIEAIRKQLETAVSGLQSGVVTDGAHVTGHIIGADGEELGPALVQVQERLEGFRKGMELRALPEEERWARAEEELGLTNVQVDEIKSAIDERDAALKEAMVPVRAETLDGGSFEVHRTDFHKAQAANNAYRERVDNTLNEQQRTDWRKKGFDSAFGGSGGGIGQTISISSWSSSEQTDGDNPFEDDE